MSSPDHVKTPDPVKRPMQRKPVPALIGLLALTLLTALVWWRVASRDTGGDGGGCPTTTPQAALPPAKLVSVTVLNSTTRAGIAKAAYAALKTEGFAVASYGNDTGHAPIAGVAEIRYGLDQKSSAQLVSYFFPGATLTLEQQSQPSIIVSLGEKYTAVSKLADAQALIARAGLSQAPSTATTIPEATVPAGC